MILVPIGHDRERFRRLPVATILLIAANLVAFGLVSRIERQAGATAEEAGSEVFQLWMEHPDLEVRSEVRELLPEPAARPGLVEAPAAGPPRDALDEGMRQEMQSRFDGAQERLLAARREMPSHRFGHVPSRGGIATLLSYQFLHGGVMHLLGNMFLLWLAGMALEDVWGRLFLPAFVLLGGAVSGLAHALSLPASPVPLIGASGAVAALMGAFLVRFAHSRIRFWYFFGFVGTFDARAIVVLPVWLGNQMLLAALLPEAPVAFTAHVGGFFAGAALAFAVDRLGVEERWLAPGVDRAAAGGVDPELKAARDLLAAGDAARAELCFRRILDRRPHDLDALRGLCETARRGERREALAERLVLLLRMVVRAGGREEAGRLLLEIRDIDGARDPRPEEWFAAARALDLEGHPAAAGEYERFAAAHPRHARAPHALHRASVLARPDGAGRAAPRGHPAAEKTSAAGTVKPGSTSSPSSASVSVRVRGARSVR